MYELYGPSYARNAYAGFWRRTIALILDFILCATACLVTAVAWRYCLPAKWAAERGADLIGASIVPVFILYMLILRLTMGGTLGYRVMRIRYAYMLNGKPAFTGLMFRSVLAIVLLLFFALDHIWIIFDERKQAWHDKVAGFYVVKCSAQPIGTQRVVRRLINFMQLTFIVWEPARDVAVPAPSTTT